MYSRDRARRSFVDSAVLRVVSQISTAVGYIILARALPTEPFGVYSLFNTFIAAIGAVLSLGLEQVLQRYSPEYLRAGNAPAAARLVRVVGSGRFAINVLLLSVILLGWNYLAPFVNVAPYRSAFLVFCVVILLYFQLRVLGLALGSHMLHRFVVGGAIVISLVKLVGYSLLAWTHRMTLETAILVDIVGYACAYVAQRIVYRKKALTQDARLPYQFTPAERKRMVRYGMLNNFNDAGGLLLYSTLDNFVIAAFLGTVSVGIYSFYSRLRMMVYNVLPVSQFQNVINPLFFSIPSANAPYSIPRYFSLLLNLNLLLQWPILAYVTAYHREIVQVVLAGKFVEYSWLLPIFLAFSLLTAVSGPVALVAQYEERAGTLLLSKLFAAYNVIAMLALVPHFGVYGATFASGTAQVLKEAFIWWRVRKRAVWLNAWASLASSIGLWGTAFLICCALKAFLPIPPLPQLLLGAVVCCAIGVVYVRGGVLSESDRSIMASILGEKAASFMRRIGLFPAPRADEMGAPPRSAGGQ
jgi:O-antigen/teichoic acid export membrane protein